MFYLAHVLDGEAGDDQPEWESETPNSRSASSRSQLEDLPPIVTCLSPTRYRSSPLRERRANPNQKTGPGSPGMQVQTRSHFHKERALRLLRNLRDYTISPHSSLKRGWELLGVALISVNLISYFSNNFLQSTFKFLPFADLYMFLDVLLRFKTGYVDPKTGNLIMDQRLIWKNYMGGWFVFDLLLSIPWGSIFRLLHNTSSLRLFNSIRKDPVGPLKLIRPKVIWTFIRNRSNRQRVLTQFREALLEKQWFQRIFHLEPKKSTLPRRTLRLIGGMFRLTRRLKIAALVADIVSRAHHGVETARALLVFSRTREHEPVSYTHLTLPTKRIV